MKFHEMAERSERVRGKVSRLAQGPGEAGSQIGYLNCYYLKSDFNPTRLRPCRKSTFATRHLLKETQGFVEHVPFQDHQ